MFKHRSAAGFSAASFTRVFGLVAGLVLVFMLQPIPAAHAQENARPYKRIGNWEIEFVQAYATTPAHCRLKRAYGTEEWLMIVFGKDLLAFDFSGLGTAALGNQLEVTYSIPPIDPKPATAKLVPIGGPGGFEVLRVVEPLDGPGSLDDLLDEARTRIEFRTKYPPADRSIPGRWSYDIKGIKPAVSALIDCRDELNRLLAMPKQPVQRNMAQNPAPAQTPARRQVDCLLVVKGRTYLDGRCEYESDKDGSFRMFGKDYFVYFNVLEKNLGDASWNADPKSTHAHNRIGEMRRDGACWVMNKDTRVCAWRLGERPASTAEKPANTNKRARYSCPAAGSIRSKESKRKAVVHFANSTGRTMDVVWIDFDGKRKTYRTLKNGEDYKQQTFVTHPWILVDKQGRCLNYVVWPKGGEELQEFFDDN